MKKKKKHWKRAVRENWPPGEIEGKGTANMKKGAGKEKCTTSQRNVSSSLITKSLKTGGLRRTEKGKKSLGGEGITK